MTDPFIHHPELRDRLIDPEVSFYRGFRIDEMQDVMIENGLPIGWWYSDDHRESLRKQALAGLGDADLWVFAYGSLMWDPGFHFAEIRRAHAPHHSRRFILKDVRGARGSPEAPGLMAALDTGDGCDGLLFRIPHAQVDHETEILCRRELVGPGYLAVFIDTICDGQPIRALTFVADHTTDAMQGDLTRQEQVHLIATGVGVFGTSLEYLGNIVEHFDLLGIEDPTLSDLLRDARAYRAAL